MICVLPPLVRRKGWAKNLLDGVPAHFDGKQPQREPQADPDSELIFAGAERISPTLGSELDDRSLISQKSGWKEFIFVHRNESVSTVLKSRDFSRHTKRGAGLPSITGTLDCPALDLSPRCPAHKQAHSTQWNVGIRATNTSK